MDLTRINAALLKMSKDPAFQKKVTSAYQTAKKQGLQFGSAPTGAGIGYFNAGAGTDDAEATYRQIVDRIKNVVQDRFPNIAYSMFDVNGPIDDGQGHLRWELTFRPSYVQRDSLYQEGYPDGLENVVLLYSHGGKPNKHKVYSSTTVPRGRSTKQVWYVPTLSLPKGYQVRPDPFLRNCVAAINAEMAKDGVTVTLDPAYYP